jgi:hypothetical protein
MTTSANITVNTFGNILAAKTTEINERATKLIAELQEFTTLKDIPSWYKSIYIPKTAQSKTWEVKALISYISDRINKEAAKKISEVEQKLNTIAKADRAITNISVSVEWAKSRTWGMCPKAEIRVCFENNTCEHYESSRITGSGYDKESTAVANALNQCNELLHAMYALKDTRVADKNNDIFGYGSGYGINPYFEGGVGVDCYYRIFEALGYKWEGVSHGKTFDVYQVNKM